MATRQLVRFNGRTIEGASTPVLQRTSRDKRLFTDLYGTWIYEQLEKERRELQRHHKRRIPVVPLRHIQQRVRVIANGAMSVDELSDQQRDELTKLGKMQTYLGEAFIAKVGARSNREDDSGRQSHRRSWKPQHKRKYDRRRGR